MNIDTLQQQIKEREEKITRIQQSKTGFEQQLSTLRVEEESLIVSARTGDEAAKTRLSEIRQGIKTAEREIRDDDAAISHVTSEVEKLRVSLASEQLAARRNKALREVALFTERAKASRDRIGAVAKELRDIGDNCVAEGKELRRLLVDVEGSDHCLSTITLVTLDVRRSVTQAGFLLESMPNADVKSDCMVQMQRFIVALEQLTTSIERAAEPVLA
jgi:chromosome segregation ATPase